MSQSDANADVLRAPLVIEFPFSRTTGPVIGAFMTGLRERRIVGIRAVDGRVICPPVEYDPVTAAPLSELVPVADEGEVVSWSWVASPFEGQPLNRPFAWAMVRFDGADTPMVHALDVAEESAVHVGQRVRVRWAEERNGDLADIECFEPVDGSGREG